MPAAMARSRSASWEKTYNHVDVRRNVSFQFEPTGDGGNRAINFCIMTKYIPACVPAPQCFVSFWAY